MPDSYAESAEGVILVANGIDPVVKWDGYTTQAETAGVIPPAAAPYLPLIQRDDPLGTAQTVTIDGGVWRRVPGSGGSDPYDGVVTGVGLVTGQYAAYVRFIDKDGNPSDLSPLSNVTNLQNNVVLYANVPTPTEAKVVRRQILRNTDGQFRTFYVDVDTENLQQRYFLSNRTDDSLAAQEAVPILDTDGSPLANRFAVPPSTKPFLAFHLGSMWFAGATAYAEGSCQVVRGSTTVTGVATRWPRTFAGRFLYVLGATRPYEIASVDVATQVATLTEAYSDATDPFAQYAIKPPPGEAQAMYFSEPGLPEAVPAINAFTLPVDDDETTGLMEYGSFLYILKRRRMYKLTAQSDPRTDGFIFYTLGRGCVNHNCWTLVEDQAYLMDEGGVYRFAGGNQAEVISSPIQNLFRRNEAGSINWTSSRFFHANYDPQQETVRWFVSFSGEYLPKTALCYHHKTNKWWTEKYPVAIAASCTGRLGRPTGGWSDDGQAVFWGGPAGAVYTPSGRLDVADADGPTVRGTATSATDDTLTDARALFDTAMANVPVCVTRGRGTGQTRVIVSATATTLRLGEPWAVLPDTTSEYQVGGIPYKYTGGRMRYSPGEAQKGRSVEIQFLPVAEPTVVNLRIYQDFSVTPRKMGREIGAGQKPGVVAHPKGLGYEVELDKFWGHFWDRFDGHREQGLHGPRLLKVELEGVGGREPLRFGEMVLNGVVR